MHTKEVKRMDTNHTVVLIVVLLVAAVGAFVLVASPGSTSMVTSPYACTASGGSWYAPYGCLMTPAMCEAADGMWRMRDNQCMNYNHVKVCELTGGSWNRIGQTCLMNVEE